jgi:hypothetical protein
MIMPNYNYLHQYTVPWSLLVSLDNSILLLTTSLDIERTTTPRVLRETEDGSEESSEKTALVVPLDKTVPELISVHIR